MNRKLPVLIAFALVVMGSTGAYAYQKPVSFVSLDVNPSIELGVNAFDVVVSAEAYNEDGENVLEDLDVVGGTVEEAVNEIVDSAITDGYIEEDGSSVISITTETDDQVLAEELEEAAEAGVEEALEENETEAEIEKDNVALARRDEARELGITPGKLNLIQKLQAVNPEALTEDFKDASVKDIMKATHEAKGIGQAKKEKDDEETVEETPGEPVAEGPDAAAPADAEPIESPELDEAVEAAEAETMEADEVKPEKEVKETKEKTEKEKPANEKPVKEETKEKTNNGKSKGK